MKKFLTIKELCVCAIFVAITAILAQITINLPSIVPISLGNLAAIITGILLTPKCAVVSQAVFVLMGTLGLPVFAGFKSGLAHTGGYLLGYPIVAFIIAFTAQTLEKRYSTLKYPVRLAIMTASSIFATAVLYTIGTLWYAWYAGVTVSAALTTTVIPFIPFDLIKIGFAMAAIYPARKRITKAYV